ncbi:hypothetical protein EDD11_009120 [Mortierella claussenii]|nr:hypothetical protein EDD11_009120 [Mortierella claussenii]
MTDTHINLFCLVDGLTSSRAFPIKVSLADTVGDLRSLIKIEKANDFNDIAANRLTLWLVSVPVVAANKHKPIVLSEFETAIELDNPRTQLSALFPESPGDTTYIIVQRPKVILDTIKEIQRKFHLNPPRSDSAPPLSSIMPLLERPMDTAVNRVVDNVGTFESWKGDRQAAKTESSFLVCSGTAGIGKTRYGRELYGALRRDLSSYVKKSGIDYSPYYYYLLMDFSSGVSLMQSEESVDAEIIVGLRLAFVHFFGSRYQERYSDYFNQVPKVYRKLFTISSVAITIRKSLELPKEQPLFLFLHIDEFQRIFDHRWQGLPEHDWPDLPGDTGVRLARDKAERYGTLEGLYLFREMMRKLGPFMADAIGATMIQTFLSGTARRDVVEAAELSSYSFHFLSCPTLSLGACYDVMGYFTERAELHYNQWMPKKALLHLLSATGGLPRALQLLLESFFGKQANDNTKFIEWLSDIDANTDIIFNKVADRLNDFYRITEFAEKNKEVVCALVRLCLLQEPAQRGFRPCEQHSNVTLELLECDAHTILEDSGDNDGKVLVRIPFFFLHLYNKGVNHVQSRLRKIFLRDWVEDRGWDFYESIIAEYEALRTELLIAGGRTTITLGDLYKGALGRQETLELTVTLEKLSVITSVHRFPESGTLTVTCQGQGQGQKRDWKSGVVIKNAAGAQFGDVCVYRQSTTGNGNGILCALQTKKRKSAITVKRIVEEHTKNTKTINITPAGGVVDRQGIKNMRLVTVLITTENMTDDAFKELYASFPVDCLLIYRDNFNSFFGEALGVPLALAVSMDHSLNFAAREALKTKHNLNDLEIDQVLENRPYRSYDDLVRKIPAMGGKGLDKEMGFLPYQDPREKVVEVAIIHPQSQGSFGTSDGIECPSDDAHFRDVTQLYRRCNIKTLTVALETPSKKYTNFTPSEVNRLYDLSNMEAPEIHDLPPFTDISTEPLESKEHIESLRRLEEELECRIKAILQTPFPNGATCTAHGHGKVDYAIEALASNGTRHVLGVTEVKYQDYGRGLAQDIVQLESSLTVRKRKRSCDDDGEEELLNSSVPMRAYGIVTDAVNWFLVECTVDPSQDSGDHPKFKISKLKTIINYNSDT